MIVRKYLWVGLLLLGCRTVMAADITLELSIAKSAKAPAVQIKTNLPSGVILFIGVEAVRETAEGFLSEAKVSVPSDQIVEFSEFSRGGQLLTAGEYRVTVGTLPAAQQPENLHAFFGEHGEALKGHLVTQLPGSQERVIVGSFQVFLKVDGALALGSPADEHQIGSADETWERVKIGAEEIYVRTNGLFFSNLKHTGSAYQGADGKSYGWDTLKTTKVYGFRSYIVSNLPESTIVGAPQSVMYDIEGNCDTRTYQLLGSLYFADKNRSGVAMESSPAEGIERKLVPNSALERAFDMLCKLSSEH